MKNITQASCLVAAFSSLILFVDGAAARNSHAIYEDDILALSMEINALQVLHDLRLAPAQIDLVTKMVKETSQKMPERKARKVSDKMRKLYQDLRQGLLDADEDKINEAMADLDDLRNVEKTEIDDDFDLTDAARSKVQEVLNKLTPRQVAIYLSQFADEFPDPAEKLTEALDEARSRRGKDWTEYRDQVAGQVGWLVGGLDKAAEHKVRTAVVSVLDQANKLSEAEYKAKKKNLEKTIRDIVDATGPAEVMKNFMLRSLAELLSNPRTATALEARKQRTK